MDSTDQRLVFLFGTTLSRGFQRGFWPPHPHPFNAESSVGSACSGIRACMAAFCHLPPPKPTEVRWRPFDVRKRLVLLPVLTNSHPSSPSTQLVTRSEGILCVLRSEQFAVLFSNTVEQNKCSIFRSQYSFQFPKFFNWRGFNLTDLSQTSSAQADLSK